MGKGNLINATSESLLSGIFDSDFVFEIPDNQRLYEWEHQQYSEFIEDLRLLAEKGYEKKRHFLNQITFIDSDETETREKGYKTKKLFDGQQRMTTTFMYMLYCYFILLDIEEYEKADEIRKYLFFQKNKHTELVDRFVSGSVNGDLIKSIFNIAREKDNLFVPNQDKEIISEDLSDYSMFNSDVLEQVGGHKSNKRILDFVLFLKSQYDTDSGLNQDTNALKKDIDNLLNRFEVIMVTISNDDEFKNEGFRIFELVNSRGKPLDDIDLIKNKIFQISYDAKVSKNTGMQIRAYWHDLLDTYTDDFKLFFRIFFSVNCADVESQGDSTSKGLYKTFLNFIDKKNETSNTVFEQANLIHDMLEAMSKTNENIYWFSSHPKKIKGRSVDFLEIKSRELNLDIKSTKIIFYHMIYAENLKYFNYHVFKLLYDHNQKVCQSSLFENSPIVAHYVSEVFNFYQRNNLFGVSDNNKKLPDFNKRLYSEYKDNENIIVPIEEFEVNKKLLNGFDFKEKVKTQKFSNSQANAALFMLEKTINPDNYHTTFESDKVEVFESEHIVPRSAFGKGSKSPFQIVDIKKPLNNYKEILGNRLLISKALNIELSDKNFDSKILGLIASDNKAKHLKQFYKIVYTTLVKVDDLKDLKDYENRLRELLQNGQQVLAADEKVAVDDLLGSLLENWLDYIGNELEKGIKDVKKK